MSLNTEKSAFLRFYCFDMYLPFLYSRLNFKFMYFIYVGISIELRNTGVELYTKLYLKIVGLRS